ITFRVWIGPLIFGWRRARPWVATDRVRAHPQAHRLAMMFMSARNQTPEGLDANVQRARQLMRIFMDHTQTMAKLKGKGEQAIVGAVTLERAVENHRGPQVTARQC